MRRILPVALVRIVLIVPIAMALLAAPLAVRPQTGSDAGQRTPNKRAVLETVDSCRIS
jgi:hypothetical protein